MISPQLAIGQPLAVVFVLLFNQPFKHDNFFQERATWRPNFFTSAEHVPHALCHWMREMLLNSFAWRMCSNLFPRQHEQRNTKINFYCAPRSFRYDFQGLSVDKMCVDFFLLYSFLSRNVQKTETKRNRKINFVKFVSVRRKPFGARILMQEWSTIKWV